MLRAEFVTNDSFATHIAVITNTFILFASNYFFIFGYCLRFWGGTRKFRKIIMDVDVVTKEMDVVMTIVVMTIVVTITVDVITMTVAMAGVMITENTAKAAAMTVNIHGILITTLKIETLFWLWFTFAHSQ